MTLSPEAVARAAGVLAALDPPAPWRGAVVSPGAWSGPAAQMAGRAVADAERARRQLVQVLGEVAQALSATARALADARSLEAAADRAQLGLTGPDPFTSGASAGADARARAAVARLRSDAAAQVHAADLACRRRLEQLLAAAPPPLPPLGPAASPEQRALAAGTSWAYLPADLAGALAAYAPGLVPAGAPDWVLDLAARERLAVEHPGLLAPAADGSTRQYLLAGPDGEVAEVWGDLSRARSVAVVVPGTYTSVDDFGSAQQQGDALYAAMRDAADGGGVAVVSWLGSPEPPNPVFAASQAYAARAAPLLRDFVRQLPLAAGARLTLVGHSYGAVVAGEAVADEGLRPAALVGAAPAGFGPQVSSAADLDGVPTYVAEDSGDVIKDEWTVQRGIEDADGLIGRLLHVPAHPGPSLVDAVGSALHLGHLGGRDPRCMPGVTELPSDHDAPDWVPFGHLSRHGEYFVPGSPSLLAIAAVAVGRPPATAPTGTCPSSADVQEPHSGRPDPPTSLLP